MSDDIALDRFLRAHDAQMNETKHMAGAVMDVGPSLDATLDDVFRDLRRGTASSDYVGHC